MAPRIDFNADDGFGFKQAAKKKKGKAAPAKGGWDDPPEEEKKDGEGEGGDGGDKAPGDTGAGAGDDGDKKDEGNGDGAGDAPPEDDWGNFAPAKSKKKGKKGAKVDDPPAADKFDAFEDIKLDAAPMLDLSFDTGISGSKSPVGTWGSSWNTGGTTTTR